MYSFRKLPTLVYPTKKGPFLHEHLIADFITHKQFFNVLYLTSGKNFRVFHQEIAEIARARGPGAWAPGSKLTSNGLLKCLIANLPAYS
jgi:hypothetical protein